MARRRGHSSFKPGSSNLTPQRDKKAIQKVRTKNLIYNIITVGLIVVICFCAYMVAEKEVNDYLTNKFYISLRGGVQRTEDDPNATLPPNATAPPAWGDFPEGDPGLSPVTNINERPTTTVPPTKGEIEDGYINHQQDIWDLHAVNPDVVAWIYIPGLAIDYPIAQRGDDFYLTHDLDGKYSYSGSIFMTNGSNINPIGQNVVVHGHNMKNRTMFGNLKNYINNNKDFFLTHRRIYLDTLYGTYRYEIFSAYKGEKNGPYLTLGFSEDAFTAFCQTVLDKGKYQYPTTFTKKDRVLTLSTCNTSAGEDYRTIIHAKLVWPDPNKQADATQTVSPTSTNSSKTPGPSASSTAAPVGSYRRVMLNDIDSTLVFRKAPNKDAAKLPSLAHGTRLKVLEDLGEWIKVETDAGTQGYVMKAYTVPEEEFEWIIPTPKPTPLPTPTPTKAPSASPTVKPSESTVKPTDSPTITSTAAPTQTPSAATETPQP